MFALMFGSTFAVCGLVCILIARKAFARDRAIASWPRAPGTITSSDVSSYMKRTRDPQGYYRQHRVYQTIVHYTYTVGGRTYESDKIARFAPATNKKPDLSPYAPGTKVMVFYDPDDPATAYLKARRSGGAVVLSVAGGVFLTIGLLVPILVLS